MDFSTFKNAVAKQFKRMQEHQLFRVQVEKDLLYSTYLSSFPEGTNPKFRERAEHECSCCNQFIRAVGDVVAIIDNKVVSVWDITLPHEESAYKAVAGAMSALVKSAKIGDLFLHYERTAGTDKNFEQLVEGVKTWEHFFVNIDSNFVMQSAKIPEALSLPRSTREVFLRGLKELTQDSVDTVLELISQGSLYRGDEHKFVLETFSKLKKQFSKLKTDEEKDIFTWVNVQSTPGSVTNINGSVIGTLLIALSKGSDLEDAVKAFEAKVAPANYKRPTALITKAMIEKAKAKLAELGLTSALERRFATINDITINNILFANREARKVISGDVFDELAATTSDKVKNLDKIEEVTIDKFIADILPRADSIEIMMENSHAGNLMSLIAPADPTAGGLFKWPNNFSWSYNGEFADSIKERVKKAGGSVTGDLCCRLAWFNHDDLDFHMIEPGGHEIYFATRSHNSPNGGRLDVDMNAGGGTTREPVENIFYGSKSTMKEGTYTLKVKNFRKRESDNVGFEVEIDMLGTVHTFAHPKAVPDGAMITVAKIKYSKKDGFTILESLPSSTAPRMIWGVPSNTFQKVNVVMMSPNHWDDKTVGNKHYFFMLNGCINDSSARGFFNEFLKEELNAHRKVFEVVGSKMKVDDSVDQLSGLGFSSTQKNTLICRVKGSFTRTLRIVF